MASLPANNANLRQQYDINKMNIGGIYTGINYTLCKKRKKQLQQAGHAQANKKLDTLIFYKGSI